MSFRIKDKIQKRISPIPLMLYEMRKGLRGFRKKGYIDCHGADHVHVYMTLKCNLKCPFCINEQVSGGNYPKFKDRSIEDWVWFLNNLSNVRELYFNGGEHFLVPGFVDLINSLDNFNVLIFSNLPRAGLDQIRRLRKNNNNIILKISYHPLNDEPLNLFVERCNEIPNGILWSPHVIKAPGVSAQLYLDAFRRYGIYGTAEDLVTPHFKTAQTKTVLCKSNEHIIGPDMRLYRCLNHLLAGTPGYDWSNYSFQHEQIECDMFPRCTSCTAYNEIRFIK